jgi:hypothetical protein
MVLLLLSFLEVSSLGNGAHGQSAQRKLRFTPLMRVETAKIVVAANGKGTYEITDQLASAVMSAVQSQAMAQTWVRLGPRFCDLQNAEK